MRLPLITMRTCAAVWPARAAAQPPASARSSASPPTTWRDGHANTPILASREGSTPRSTPTPRAGARSVPADAEQRDSTQRAAVPLPSSIVPRTRARGPTTGPATSASASNCHGAAAPTLRWSSLRSNASNLAVELQPSVTAQLQAVVSQPLLRNFKIDPLRAEIATARKNLEIADTGSRNSHQLSASAQRAYWNLVLAKAAVALQQRSLELSLELERNKRARRRRRPIAAAYLVSGAPKSRTREGVIVTETLFGGEISCSY